MTTAPGRVYAVITSVVDNVYHDQQPPPTDNARAHRPEVTLAGGPEEAQNELVQIVRLRCHLIGLLLALCPGGHLEASGPAVVPGFSETAWPGEASFQSYGPEEDLMSMGITALAQDRDGFLWVGSDLGLYRFDRHRFLNIGPAEGLTIGPDSHLWRIRAAESGPAPSPASSGSPVSRSIPPPE